ncbi:MAG: carboxypeptidase regulatory-like domain-containing protein, partial [Planctomycetes bacterium]|nr:carboxypeptidase regulatory-like domain-containing protein [Planctomycetota bacterium]
MSNALVTFLGCEIDSPCTAITLLRQIVDFSESPETQVQQRGTTYRADENGQLLVPPGPGLVMARAGTEWNLAPLPGGDTEPFELRLEADTSLDVRVLEADGSPAGGILIEICRSQDLPPYLELSELTDEETGEIRIPHLGWILRQLDEGLFGQAGRLDSFLITPIIHLPDLPVIELKVSEPPPRSVELHLPPYGRVVLVASQAARGQLDPSSLWTDLLVQGQEDGSVREMVNWWIPIQDVAEDGHSIYTRVGLGLQFEAQFGDRGRGISFERTFPGPTVAGETVEVEFEFPDPFASFAVRLLDESGAPLAGVSCTYRFTDLDGKFIESNRRTTDQDGRTEFLLERAHEKRTERDVRVRISVEDGPLARSGEFLWTLPHSSESVRVGDLVLAASPLLVAGRVTDPDGNPIENASVRCWSPSSSSRHATRTDRDGAFSLRGSVELTTISVGVSHGGHTREELHDVPAGSTDLRIELGGAGSIAGSLALEGYVLEPDIVALATPRPVDSPQPDWPWSLTHEKMVDADGEFRLDHLPPGHYDVAFRLVNDAEPLAIVEDVRVQLGETTNDPRLRELELRGLKLIELRFVHDGKSAIGDGQIALIEPAGSEASYEEGREFWCNSGFVSFYTRHDAVDVRASFDE